MKIHSTIYLLISFSHVFAQSDHEYYVLDKDSRNGIPYATIVIDSAGKTFSTNEQGFFKLEKSSFFKVNVSAVSYVNRVISKEQLLKLDTIYLQHKFTELSSVIVRPGKTSDKFLSAGITGRKHDFSYACDSTFNSTQFALQINLPKHISSCTLKRIHIRIRKSTESITRIHPARIHLYNYLEGKPGDDLLKKDILITRPDQLKNAREIEVDISGQEIQLSNHPVFVAIEFLKTFEEVNYSEPQLLMTERKSAHQTFRKNFWFNHKYTREWAILAKEGVFYADPGLPALMSDNILAWIDVGDINPSSY